MKQGESSIWSKDEINKLSTYYDEYLLIPLLLENVEVYRVVKEDRVGLAIS